MSKSPLESKRALFVRNLVTLYTHSSQHAHEQGSAWYPEARRIVREWSESYLLPVECVAMVVAAISPQCEWPRNLIIADDVLAGRAQSVGGALHRNVAKARTLRDRADNRLDVMMSFFPHGPKVNSFAHNLAGFDNVVTVDTHAIQAAFDDVRVNVTLAWTPYRIIAESYAETARHVGIAPATLQATIWHAWKERYPRIVKRQARRKDR